MGFVLAELLTVQYQVWYMLGAVLLALVAVLTVELKTQKFRFVCRVKGKPDTSYANDTGDTDVDTKISDDSCSNGDSGIGEERCSGDGVVKIKAVEQATTL